jgi:F0F1-type ATP synthase assembly protein I
MTGEAGGQGRGARRGSAVPSLGEYAGVGLQFAFTIVAFMFAGMWLDRTLGTSPWLLILFVFAGAAAGFYSIYRKLMAAQRRADEARRAERGTP